MRNLLAGNALKKIGAYDLNALKLYLAAPAYLIGLPTLMMGMSFSYLQRAVQTDLAGLGRRVGLLQTTNIIGSLLGAVVTGLYILHWLGSTGAIRLLAALGVIFPIFLLFCGKPRISRLLGAGALAALLVASAAAVPRFAHTWGALHGAASGEVIVAEDRSGISVLKLNADRTVVVTNGLKQSSLPFGGVHTALGALPVLLHPAPIEAAVIGLGSGDTLFSVGARAETRTIESIEIVQPELHTLRALDKLELYPALRALLRDPRIRHSFTDGRAFILKRERKYDVIEADALRPTSAFAGNLYSLEYFELLRDHLKDGGFGVTWGPTSRVDRTFVKAFPHVLRFESAGTSILIGSNQPIQFEAHAVRRRLADPFTRAYFAAAHVDIEGSLQPYLESTPIVYGPEVDRAALTDINRDLFPKDEFALP
jgi:spermidine synthase